MATNQSSALATECVAPANYAGKAGRRKKNVYEYTGAPVPAIDPEQNADFIHNYQKSVLLALVERGLLTGSQCEQCIEELGRRRIAATGGRREASL